MFVLYNLFVLIYTFGIRVVALFNAKAGKWVVGRKGIMQKLKSTIQDDDKIIWVHCASLGEFEQGKPVIEGFKKQFPDHKILLTFFSPSGYEIRKDYPTADYVFYLPADTPKNARQFVEIVRPDLVVFVKYEYWFNYIRILNRKQIPLVFISAIFRPDQYFFKGWGSWFRKQLRTIDQFYIQNEKSAELLKSIGVTNYTISGDTRFDSVITLAEEEKSFPLIEKFIGEKKLFIAGSTWPPDEDLMKAFLSEFKDEMAVIIAPHEVTDERIREVEKKIGIPSIRYTELDEENANTSHVLILNTVGILKYIYRYAFMVYIGNGFGHAIHNIQEPITYGKPVLFGPNYTMFREAVELAKQKAANPVHNNVEFVNACRRLYSDAEYYRFCSDTSKNYVMQNKGATDIIINGLKTYL